MLKTPTSYCRLWEAEGWTNLTLATGPAGCDLPLCPTLRTSCFQQHEAHTALPSFLLTLPRHEDGWGLRELDLCWSQEHSSLLLVHNRQLFSVPNRGPWGPGASLREAQGAPQTLSSHVKQSHRQYMGGSQFPLSQKADKFEFCLLLLSFQNIQNSNIYQEDKGKSMADFHSAWWRGKQWHLPTHPEKTQPTLWATVREHKHSPFFHLASWTQQSVPQHITHFFHKEKQNTTSKQKSKQLKPLFTYTTAPTSLTHCQSSDWAQTVEKCLLSPERGLQTAGES